MNKFALCALFAALLFSASIAQAQSCDVCNNHACPNTDGIKTDCRFDRDHDLTCETFIRILCNGHIERWISGHTDWKPIGSIPITVWHTGTYSIGTNPVTGLGTFYIPILDSNNTEICSVSDAGNSIDEYVVTTCN